MLLRVAAFTVGLMACVAPARAHVVTNVEAGKLTLDALTEAPKPVYRPIYRRYTHSIMATRRVARYRHHGHGRRTRG